MKELTIKARAEWSSIFPRRRVIGTSKGLGNVVTCATCLNFEHRKLACSNVMKLIQYRHMKTTVVPDIKYNFVICPHGTVFEGRGFGACPGLPMKYFDLNQSSVFIGLHGEYNVNPPSQEMLEALNLLILRGMETGYLSKKITHYCL